MHVAVFQVIDIEFSRACAEVTFFKEVASEFSGAIGPIQDVCDSKDAQIELPAFDQQRVCHVFLDHELSHRIQKVLSCSSLDEISDLVDFPEYLYTAASVRILARFYDPYARPSLPLLGLICVFELIIARVPADPAHSVYGHAERERHHV